MAAEKKQQLRQKNYPKYNSYALAFKLIDESIRHNFPLQAITIEESILADRLWSTLNVGKNPDKVKLDTLSKALNEWKPREDVKGCKLNPNRSLFDEEIDALYTDLKDWWKDRCNLLHGIVKSAQGKHPVIPAETFESSAAEAAKKGLSLVREIDKWSKRQVRKAQAKV